MEVWAIERLIDPAEFCLMANINIKRTRVLMDYADLVRTRIVDHFPSY